jgi:hypothetical protein
MATSATPLLRRSSAPRNASAPALCLTLCLHLAAVCDRLLTVSIHGTLRPSWRPAQGGQGFVCYVAIDVARASEDRAHREVRETLIHVGFVVGGAPSPEPHALRVSSYHGGPVYAEDRARCPGCASGGCLRHDVLFAELRDAPEAPHSRRIVATRRAA